MTKQEILPVVKKMLADYLEIAKHKEELVIIDTNPLFNRGFCNYLYQKAFPTVDYDAILRELFIDYLTASRSWVAHTYKNGYWYPVLRDFELLESDTQADFEETIQPRIDHLLRTIARLETTLKV